MNNLPAVGLLGVPYDQHSSFLRGSAGAPTAVRAALTNGSANWAVESGADLDPDGGALADRWTDLGDLAIVDGADLTDASPFTTIRNGVSTATADGTRLLCIGGDHAVTWPIMQATAPHHDDITIVHFDAHPDLYDELDGDRLSHACPFARIMEEDLVGSLIQIGIRTMTPHQQEQAERFRVEVITMSNLELVKPVLGSLTGPVYVSVDVDALDPAFVPGTSHHEPGGLTTRELLTALHQLGESKAEVIGADLVEINPKRDVNDMTAMLGAKLVRELLALLLAV